MTRFFFFIALKNLHFQMSVLFNDTFIQTTWEILGIKTMSSGIFFILLIILLSMPLDSTGLYFKGIMTYKFHVYFSGKSQKYRYLRYKKMKNFDSRWLRQDKADITCTECASSLTKGMDYRIARSRNFIRMARRIENKLKLIGCFV